MEKTYKRVLNIASHVVHGHVGNCATIFPLQLHGFTVNSINSVQFSNHTKYPAGIKGQVLTGQDVLDLIEGMDNNNLLINFSHMLTGYIASASFLDAIEKVVDKLKEKSPNVRYICDPVMGDNGKFYVPSGQEMSELFMTKIIPKAYMITPNQFEAEVLTKSEITNEEQAFEVIDKLHAVGPEIVIITSSSLKEKDGILQLFGSWQKDKDTQIRIKVDIPKIESAVQPNFTGTGDLLSSMLLANIHKYPDDFPKAVEIALNIVRGVLLNTIEEPVMGSKEEELTQYEIQIVGSKSIIENPKEEIKAQIL